MKPLALFHANGVNGQGALDLVGYNPSDARLRMKGLWLS